MREGDTVACMKKIIMLTVQQDLWLWDVYCLILNDEGKIV